MIRVGMQENAKEQGLPFNSLRARSPLEPHLEAVPEEDKIRVDYQLICCLLSGVVVAVNKGGRDHLRVPHARRKKKVIVGRKSGSQIFRDY